MRRFILPLIMLSALTLPACGGGGGGVAEGIVNAFRQVLPPKDPDIQGFVSDFGSVHDADVLYVGDSLNTGWRGMVGFDMDDPIDGSSYVGATLVLDLRNITGDPARLGRLWVEAVEMGDDLDATDYGRAAYAAIRVEPEDIQEGILNVNVHELVFEAYARGQRNMDFRLRFSVENSGNGDGDDGLNVAPIRLQIDWD